ncbi:DUF2497 domain-containing protein [Xanthobacter sp. KR7-65]|uniref:PopZ family protein n=1 Tax=Xanthobacter sp. KR7-65 TaxID=3156612 RepID=UPI0032B46376
MEEILASIRRIMADDEMPQAPARPAPRADGTERRRPEVQMATVQPNPSRPGPAYDGAPYGASDPRPRRPADAAPAEHEPAPARPAHLARRPLTQEAPVHPNSPSPHASAQGSERAWPDEADDAGFAEAAALRRARMQRRPADAHSAPPNAPAGHDEFESAPQRRAAPAAAPREAAPPPRPQARPPARDWDASDAAASTERPASAEATRRRDLLSPTADAAVDAAFRSLGDVLLPQKDRTVEDLVKEILRPMLKDWLDANLPTIVEALVRAEIERVARRPR